MTAICSAACLRTAYLFLFNKQIVEARRKEIEESDAFLLPCELGEERKTAVIQIQAPCLNALRNKGEGALPMTKGDF